METPPHLHHSRLSLREATELDIPFLRDITHTDGWLRFIGDRGTDTEEGARAYYERTFRDNYRTHGFALWVLALAGYGPIGLVGLVPRAQLPVPDLGYALLPDFQGQGLLQAAIPEILVWAREVMGLRMVPAYIDPENERSRHTLQRLGFHWTDTVEMELFRPGLTECWEMDTAEVRIPGQQID